MDDAAIGLAGIWALSLLALAYMAVREILHVRRQPGQGAPRWAPDPAFDPALVEDEQVAELDALYYMPTAEPRAW